MMICYIDCLPYDCEYGAHCYRLYFTDHTEICYSPNGASEQSGYTTTYIQSLCKQDKIKCYWFRVGWYIPIEQVKALKERKKNHGKRAKS